MLESLAVGVVVAAGVVLGAEGAVDPSVFACVIDCWGTVPAFTTYGVLRSTCSTSLPFARW